MERGRQRVRATLVSSDNHPARQTTPGPQQPPSGVDSVAVRILGVPSISTNLCVVGNTIFFFSVLFFSYALSVVLHLISLKIGCWVI